MKPRHYSGIKHVSASERELMREPIKQAFNKMRKEMLTYRELLKEMQTWTDEQLDAQVTVYGSTYDEYYQVHGPYMSDNSDDRLDAEQPILELKDG